MKTASPNYGNWVSGKRIVQTFLTFLVFAAVAAALLLFVSSVFTVVVGIIAAILAAFLLIMVIYFLRAQHLFSYNGGKIQRKILELVMRHIRWDGHGRALDIGCGSGALTVMLAKAYPSASVTGIDYWDGSWGYFQKQCEDNARAEGVAAEFLQASASALPFPDESFDLAVSNLVFHEVKDSADKREVIREALRVVKKGGCFVFQDLFQMTPYFGTREQLLALVRSWGVQEVHYEDTSKAPFIPHLLKLPFMVGALA